MHEPIEDFVTQLDQFQKQLEAAQKEVQQLNEKLTAALDGRGFASGRASRKPVV